MKTLKGKKGFTLIEVIVILAVIAILAAVLTPMIIGYVSDARVSRAQADVKTLAAAVTAFNKDMKDWPIYETDAKRKTGTTPYATLASDDGDAATGASAPSNSGIIDVQLMTNNSTGYPSTGGSKWLGPYLETVKADPWGSKYYIYVSGLQPTSISLTGASYVAAYVISAGPNKIIDTTYTAGPTVTPLVDDILFRIK